MRKSPLPVLLAVVAVFMSCATDPNATEVASLDGYPTWFQVNSEIITGDATGTLGRNVHQGSTGFRNVFVNPVGEAVITGDADTPYPAGTIFVKDSYAEQDGAMGDLADVTVMVKREAGFDPDNGDWEYMLLTNTLSVRNQGAIGMCISCHAAAANRDFVFASY